jgi:hypothetical protein
MVKLKSYFDLVTGYTVSTVAVTQTGLMADGLHSNPFGWSKKKNRHFENQQMTAKSNTAG